MLIERKRGSTKRQKKPVESFGGIFTSQPKPNAETTLLPSQSRLPNGPVSIHRDHLLRISCSCQSIAGRTRFAGHRPCKRDALEI